MLKRQINTATAQLHAYHSQQDGEDLSYWVAWLGLPQDPPSRRYATRASEVGPSRTVMRTVRAVRPCGAAVRAARFRSAAFTPSSRFLLAFIVAATTINRFDSPTAGTIPHRKTRRLPRCSAKGGCQLLARPKRLGLRQRFPHLQGQITDRDHTGDEDCTKAVSTSHQVSPHTTPILTRASLSRYASQFARACAGVRHTECLRTRAVWSLQLPLPM